MYEYYRQINIDLKIPEEALGDIELKKFREKIDSFKFQPVDEFHMVELNETVKACEKYLRENYPFDKTECKSNCPLSYYETEWGLKDILNAYKEEYPERYEAKDKYTRIEVNNMLFDLELADVIGSYSNIIYSYSSEKEKDDYWDGLVEVKCRYE